MLKNGTLVATEPFSIIGDYKEIHMRAAISDDATVSVAKDQVATELGGEFVILNLKTGTYYGLEEVSARIWNFIQEPQTVQSVRSKLLQEYNVDKDRCHRDLMNLLRKLEGEGLITIGEA